jgi:hypothetical protein
MSTLGMMVAFAVDLGYLATARTELQRSADAAALAATYALASDPLGASINTTPQIAAAKAQATVYAGLNTVCNSGPVLDTSATGGDVVAGYLSNPSDQSCTLNTSSSLTNSFNAVQVRVRRTSSQNGNVPLFFGRILGLNGIAAEAQATGAILRNFKGFKAPDNGQNLGILPFALDKATWDALLAGGGTDNYSWDPVTQTISNASDGIHEVDLYPHGTGSAGNRGTVDIGNNNNSTPDIERQILHGVSPADLAAIGGELALDSGGHLNLNGDTGISAGFKDALTSITGQSRIIPIFDQVTGPGNNASFRIVGFAGVRILAVDLTGGGKKVVVQPARMVVNSGIQGGTTQTSYYVYSAAWLVR